MPLRERFKRRVQQWKDGVEDLLQTPDTNRYRSAASSTAQSTSPTPVAGRSTLSLPLQPSISAIDTLGKTSQHLLLGNAFTSEALSTGATLTGTPPPNRESKFFTPDWVIVPPDPQSQSPTVGESPRSALTTTVAPSSDTPSGSSGNATRWRGAKTFLRLLDQSAGVFGPIKAVVGEFISCAEVYEVRISIGFPRVITEIHDRERRTGDANMKHYNPNLRLFLRNFSNIFYRVYHQP